MLARDLAHSLDPVLLAAAVGLPDLDPWQSTLLRSMRPGASALGCLHTLSVRFIGKGEAGRGKRGDAI